MVLDRLANASMYFSLGDGIAAALRYLQSTDFDALEPGRYEIAGAHVFALVSEYETQPADDVPWEAHRQHIDVQFVHRGEERIAFAHLADLTAGPYDAARDFVPADGAVALFLPLRAGAFAILGPLDAHKPGVAMHAPARVKKVVVKVRTSS